MRRTLVFGAVFLWFATPVLAETTFITDKIVVELFSSTHQRGMLVTTVNTGATVEVIETDGDYSKVRTNDNLVGWLHSKYLSKEKPAQLNYLQLMAKHKQLQEEMSQIRSQVKNPVAQEKEKILIAKIRDDLKNANKTISNLENKLKEKSTELKETQTQLAALKTEPSEKQSKTPEASAVATETATPEVEETKQELSPPSQTAFSLDYPLAIKWTLIVSLLCIFMGIYLGHAWLDAKIRKRHGGVRIR